MSDLFGPDLADFCSNGGVGTSACPDSDQENHECEPVAPDGTCLAGGTGSQRT